MATVSTSRGLLGLAGGIVAGAVSGGMLVYSLMPPENFFGALIRICLAYMIMIPLLVAGLGAGIGSGILASLTGIAGLYFVDLQNTIGYAVSCALPALMITVLALHNRLGSDQKIHWFPEGRLVTAIALYPCVVFLVAVLATLHEEGGLLGATIRIFAKTAHEVADAYGPEMADQMTSMASSVAGYLPAFMGASWAFLALLSFYAARMCLGWFHLNLRETFSLGTMEVPTWTIFAAAATGLLGLFAPAPYDYIGTNLCGMLCVPFFLTGLVVVHAYAATTKMKSLILGTFYMLFAWLVPLVAVLGALDQWFYFRRRFAGAKQGG
jgi:hypothetical protein